MAKKKTKKKVAKRTVKNAPVKSVLLPALKPLTKLLTKAQYPKSISGIIDKLQQIKLARAQANKIADEWGKCENEFNDYIFETFGKSKLKGAKGKTHQLTLAPQVIPVIDDYKKICKGILSKKLPLDILQKRLSSSLVKAMWKEGKKIPGIGKFTTNKISLTKLTK